MGKRRKSPGWAIVLIGLSALLVVETIGRLAGAPVYPPNATFISAPEWRYPQHIARDSKLFWRYRPGRTITGKFFARGMYTINSDGFRGMEIPSAPSEGVIRVVCLGGSTTFGLEVSDEAAYPRRLEEALIRLDPQSRGWEVINAGVTNYSTYQGLALARKWLDHWNPDIVLFSYTWGDLQRAPARRSDADIELTAAWRITLGNVLRQFATIQWVESTWLRLTQSEQTASAGTARSWRVGASAYSANIEKLAGIIRRQDARAIWVSPPISWPPPGQSDTSGLFHYHHRYHRIGRYAAISAGAEYAELANPFNTHPEFFTDRRRENELFTSEGHAFAGEFLARFILGLPTEPADTTHEQASPRNDPP